MTEPDPEKDYAEAAERRNALFAVSDGVLGAAALLAVGVYAGNFLDSKFHTAPIISISLSLLGAGAGLARLVQKANALDSKKPRQSMSSKEKPEAKIDSQSKKDGNEPNKQRNPFDNFDD